MVKTSKNILVKAAGLMLGATMLMATVIGGTMAKYTSKGTISGASAKAAEWSIKVGNEPGQDLKETVTLSDLSWTVTEIESGATKGSYADETIVPGTWGYAEIKLSNKGQVDAKVTIDNGFTLPTGNTGLQFAVMTTKPESDSGVSDESQNLKTNGFELKRSGENGADKSIFIAYKWDFDNDDQNKDTEQQGKTFNFEQLTLTADQVGGPTE